MVSLQEKLITIGEVEFKLQKWDLRKQLKNNNVVMPLIKEPFINAVALSESGNEDAVMLSILEGIISALEVIDLERVADILLDGTTFKKKGSVGKIGNLDNFAENGLGMAEVLGICANVIIYNYGDLLKKDLLASLIPTDV